MEFFPPTEECKEYISISILVEETIQFSDASHRAENCFSNKISLLVDVDEEGGVIFSQRNEEDIYMTFIELITQKISKCVKKVLIPSFLRSGWKIHHFSEESNFYHITSGYITSEKEENIVLYTIVIGSSGGLKRYILAKKAALLSLYQNV